MIKKKLSKKEVADFIGISIKTVYNWLKEERKFLSFIDKYLTNEDLVEFNTTGKCSRFEDLEHDNSLSYYDLTSIYSFTKNINSFPQEEKINREGFLLKIYFSLNAFGGEYSDFSTFCSSLSVDGIGKAKNAELGVGFHDVKYFFENYLSKNDQKVIIDKKSFILPILKSMRKYN